MRALLAVVLTLCLALPVAQASGTNGLEIEVQGGRVTVRAQKVPLNRILDRLAQQTGMKVAYESTPPSQPVTAILESLPIRDAVVRLMEGLGVPYVFRTDVSGQRVETLFVSDASGSGGSRTTTASSSMSQDPIEYPTEVVEDMQPEYEEPIEIPQPIPGVMPELTNAPPPGTPAPDLALPNMGAGPGFPNQVPGQQNFPGQPSFPGPVSNPFPR
jgi:hypothetical protein